MNNPTRDTQAPPDNAAVQAGHEELSINTGSVIRWTGILFSVLLLGMWIASRLIQLFSASPDPVMHDRADLGRLSSGGVKLDPNQPATRRRLHAEQLERLTSYGWVDEPGGIARIPVDVAIDRFVAGENADQTGEDSE